MTSLRSIGFGLALALVATSALGFQEQKAGSGSPAPEAAQAVEQKPAAQVAPSTDSAATAGREVRIPGLGRLGVLPKMDFGLELLYGASEQKPAAEAPRDNSEDLTIRGSVKHRF